MACDGAYCVPSFTSSVFPISNVTFAGINNTTTNGIGGTDDLQAFCDTASVDRGSTYTINITGNTSGGGNTFYEKAYFDWNQNGLFGDVADEIYFLGGYSNAGTDVFSANIAVPTGANLGTTRMRVMHRFAGYSTTSCQTGGGYGQAEDYNVTVSAPTPPSNDACSGAISLTASVDTTCSTTTGSTQNATDNNENGDCTAGTELAVWYSFVATSTSHDVTVDGATGIDAVIGAISSCGTTTTPAGGACTDATLAGDVEILNLTGLTIGNTYYVQVYDY